MGIIVKGILGGFRGTVGTVVGGSWKGIDYMKSLPVISSTDPTPKQLEQREKFKTVVDFIRPLMGLIQIGFKAAAKNMTEYNAAFAYNYKNALDGNYPSFSINYDFALLTSGVLPNVGTPVATAEPASIIKFTWLNNAGTGIAAAVDKMILVVYCPELKDSIYVVGSKMRSDLTANIDATAFSGKVVHTWISCLADDERTVATSVYTGQLTVS